MRRIHQGPSTSNRFIIKSKVGLYQPSPLRDLIIHQNPDEEENPSGFFEFRYLHEVQVEDEKKFNRISSNRSPYRAE